MGRRGKDPARFGSIDGARVRWAGRKYNQALNALVFLYRAVLGKEPGVIGVFECPTRKPRLPTVLSKEETSRLLAVLAPDYQLMLLYGTGMRLMECLRLRVKDTDFAQSKIEVNDGKRFKDRIWATGKCHPFDCYILISPTIRTLEAYSGPS